VTAHTLVPHKEVRFIYLALAVAPILIGLGASALLSAWAKQRGPLVLRAGVPLLLVMGACLSWRGATALPLSMRWEKFRAVQQAFALARTEQNLCGMAVLDVPPFATGGYTYFHRDAPLFIGELPPVMRLPGATVPLRGATLLRSTPLPLLPSQELRAAPEKYNVLIAPKGAEIAGFTPLACFDDIAGQGWPTLCVLRRPGACS
jgi:hypothetical protein